MLEILDDRSQLFLSPPPLKIILGPVVNILWSVALSRDAQCSLFLLWGGAGQRKNFSGQGGVTVKPQVIFQVGRAGQGILKNFQARATRGSHFPI